MDADSKRFSDWIGRTTEATDMVTERLVAEFRAIFELHLAPLAGDAAPLGIHWCLSPEIAAMADLGPDGHPAKDRDVPPVPQPRRMWAGGSLDMLKPLRMGDRVARISTIAGVTKKEGRSGELWFVAVDRDYVVDGATAIRERHDIVYREPARPATVRRAEPGRELLGTAPVCGPSWTVETTPAFLFRYSAITFNGHRIHYDLPYATGVEGYRGLVVHGPILATLLLNLAAVATAAPPTSFHYRGRSPAICGDALSIGAGAGSHAGTYWTEGPDGRISMTASTTGT